MLRGTVPYTENTVWKCACFGGIFALHVQSENSKGS